MNLRNRTIYIGDNLPRLKGIDSESVDLIYLDPPFNSRGEYQWPIGQDEFGWQDDQEAPSDDLDDDALSHMLEHGGPDHFKDAFTLDDLDERTLDQLLADGEPAGYVIAAAGQAVGAGTQSYLTYMWERLAEMHRILKPTGSLYLHCDDTEGAWLKALMDAVFGRENFRNEITWQRTGAHSDPDRFGRVADTLLYYTKSSQARFWRFAVAVPQDDDYLAAKYRRDDNDGRGKYQDISLTGPGVTRGQSGRPWRGYDPTSIGRCWSAPRARGRNEYGDWIAANVIEGYDEMTEVHQRLDALAAHGMIHWTRNGKPRLKRYLAAVTDQVPGVIWTDISPINSQADEDTGWDTQKPLDLLERIVAASSREGDLVLDPFCGCATACVAAERLGRRWAGMDRSPRAGILVRKRLREQDEGVAIWASDVVVTRAVPERTDISEPSLPKAELKRILFERQRVSDGDKLAACAAAKLGCPHILPIELLELDRLRPGVAGGEYTLANTQLLCARCNRAKGKRDMAYLAERLAALQA